MSDELRFSVAVSEGPHDVEALGKILRLKGFQEARRFDQVPEDLRSAIPTHYPMKGERGELSRFVAHPTFLFRGNYWILASSAGGIARLGENLRDLLSSFRKQYTDTALRGIAVLADADQQKATEALDGLFRQMAGAFADEDDLIFDPARPSEIQVSGSSKPFAAYIFPNGQDAGTLENVLLEGARHTYPQLLAAAEQYVAYAKTLPCAGKLADNFNGDKATVGVIANVLRPGRANQVSIHDNDWFTADSLDKLPSHQALAAFIDTVIRWEDG